MQLKTKVLIGSIVTGLVLITVAIVIAKNDELGAKDEASCTSQTNPCGVWTGKSCIRGEIEGLFCVHKGNKLVLVLLVLGVLVMLGGIGYKLF